MSNPKPNTKDPLVITPSPPGTSKAIDDGLGQLSRLVGTWNSVPEGTYSWNVMPLPQDNAKFQFILKNFAYLEEVTFAKIPGTAPNRGGGFTQVANTLFYEQRVYFSPSTTGSKFPVPAGAEYTLVHAENGSWLFLDNNYQFDGAFPISGSSPTPFPSGVTQLPNQNPDNSIVKQMSVPHGNSILAMGNVDPPARFTQNNPPISSPNNPTTPTLPTNAGNPDIPQLNAIPEFQGAPYGAPLYGPSNIQNGIETNSNINPNIKLLDYLKAFPPTNYVHFKVSAPASEITNIDFENKHSKVNGYEMEIWLLNPGTADVALMYYQNIGMQMTLSSSSQPGTKVINFPHITANVVRPAT